MANQRPPSVHPTSAPGRVRIIGGQWKRTPLKVLNRPGLRPTPDRVRETLFNWLPHDLRGWHVLDAFAGSGALGLEAASRGAAAVSLVEQDAALVTQLRQTVDYLHAHQVSVQRGDGLAALRQAAPGSLDLILLDPPFASNLAQPALQAAAAALRSGGWVYVETGKVCHSDEMTSHTLRLHRSLSAGAVHAYLLQHDGAAHD